VGGGTSQYRREKQTRGGEKTEKLPPSRGLRKNWNVVGKQPKSAKDWGINTLHVNANKLTQKKKKKKKKKKKNLKHENYRYRPSEEQNVTKKSRGKKRRTTFPPEEKA